MAYNITVRTNNKSDKGFNIVEKTVWHGGIWSSRNGIQKLTMDDSGTSGTLRYMNKESGEHFVVALGVHNYKRWCEILVNLAPKETAAQRHAFYYNGGHAQHGMLWKQLPEISSTTSAGTRVVVKYLNESGHDYDVLITIS